MTGRLRHIGRPGGTCASNLVRSSWVMVLALLAGACGSSTETVTAPTNARCGLQAAVPTDAFAASGGTGTLVIPIESHQALRMSPAIPPVPGSFTPFVISIDLATGAATSQPTSGGSIIGPGQAAVFVQQALGTGTLAGFRLESLGLGRLAVRLCAGARGVRLDLAGLGLALLQVRGLGGRLLAQLVGAVPVALQLLLAARHDDGHQHDECHDRQQDPQPGRRFHGFPPP